MRSRPTHSRCVRCGAPAAPRQEICLQCGAQLPDSGPSAFELTVRRRAPWLPLDLLVPLVVLALVTLASAAVALGARHERQASAPTLLETATTRATTTTTAAERTTTRPAATRPPSTGGPTISTGTLPVAPGAPSTAARTTPPPTTRAAATTAKPGRRPPANVSGSWPSGTTGWTVIVQSLPASPLGRSEALATARKARRAGLSQVGVLLSSRYSTLRNGYWAVYTGVFPSSAAAQGAAATASRRGFPGAYPARVAP